MSIKYNYFRSRATSHCFSSTNFTVSLFTVLSIKVHTMCHYLISCDLAVICRNVSLRSPRMQIRVTILLSVYCLSSVFISNCVHLCFMYLSSLVSAPVCRFFVCCRFVSVCLVSPSEAFFFCCFPTPSLTSAFEFASLHKPWQTGCEYWGSNPVPFGWEWMQEKTPPATYNI